jgi:hypothetical protein
VHRCFSVAGVASSRVLREKEAYLD